MYGIFFFNDTATTEIYTLSLHDALPILTVSVVLFGVLAYFDLPVNDLPAVDYPVIQVNVGYPGATPETMAGRSLRSEEHTSELQSHLNLVCRLLLQKKT